jgi:Protein of unknown function (DUF3574)
MRRLTLSVITPIALAFSMLMATPAYARQDVDAPGQDQPVIQRRIPEAARSGALPFVRTELFFGTAKPDGVVTDGEFRDFVDYVVTPRFPDGLTLLQGDGQFRGADNVIIKEASYVLILLYPGRPQSP